MTFKGGSTTNDHSRESQAAVLGIVWDKQRDCLSLNVPALDQFCKEKVTKRNILLLAHRVFDRLGLTCPIVLCPRILLQQAWAHGLSWDEEVNRFLKWVKGLKDLNKLEIPRYLLGEIIDKDRVSIHFVMLVN